MKKLFFDCKRYFNDRLHFQDLISAKKSPIYREWNIAVCDEGFFGLVSKDGYEAKLEKNCDGQDHIVCLGQSLDMGGVLCQEVVFAGFALCGPFTESFTFVFQDGEQQTDVFFSDVCYPMKDHPKLNMKLDFQDIDKDYVKLKDFTVYHQLGHLTGYCYGVKVKFSDTKQLKQICLPDNLMIRLQAVTLR